MGKATMLCIFIVIVQTKEDMIYIERDALKVGIGLMKKFDQGKMVQEKFMNEWTLLNDIVQKAVKMGHHNDSSSSESSYKRNHTSEQKHKSLRMKFDPQTIASGHERHKPGTITRKTETTTKLSLLRQLRQHQRNDSHFLAYRYKPTTRSKGTRTTKALRIYAAYEHSTQSTIHQDKEKNKVISKTQRKRPPRISFQTAKKLPKSFTSQTATDESDSDDYYPWVEEPSEKRVNITNRKLVQQHKKDGKVQIKVTSSKRKYQITTQENEYEEMARRVKILQKHYELMTNKNKDEVVLRNEKITPIQHLRHTRTSTDKSITVKILSDEMPSFLQESQRNHRSRKTFQDIEKKELQIEDEETLHKKLIQIAPQLYETIRSLQKSSVTSLHVEKNETLMNTSTRRTPQKQKKRRTESKNKDLYRVNLLSLIMHQGVPQKQSTGVVLDSTTKHTRSLQERPKQKPPHHAHHNMTIRQSNAEMKTPLLYERENARKAPPVESMRNSEEIKTFLHAILN